MTLARRQAPEGDPDAAGAQAPELANAVIVTAMVTINGWLWVGLPLLAHAHGAAWGWSLVAVVLVTTTYWSVLHEAFHGVLFRDRRANLAAGRVLAVLLCCSFRALRFGHLTHHRFNRSPLDRTEVVSRQQRRRPGTWLFYYARLTFGLHLVEVLGGWSTLLPKRAVAWVVRSLFGAVAPDGRTAHNAAVAQLLSRAGLAEMRTDAAASLALVAGGFWLYGELWWMLALALAGRGFMISFFDNPYHYRTPLDRTLYATSLTLPRPLERAILNFNLHGAHHLRPTLPWTGLPAFARRNGLTGHTGYLVAALAQLRGPLAEDALPAAERPRDRQRAVTGDLRPAPDEAG